VATPTENVLPEGAADTTPGAATRALSRWRRSAFFAAVLLVLTFLGLSLYADAGQIAREFEHFSLLALAPALGWSALSYGLRAARFQLYLLRVHVRIEHTEAVLVFLAGMSMSATPGKVGEVLKSLVLKWRHDVPLSRSLPVIVVERAADMIALLSLTAWGVWSLPYGPSISAALVLAALSIGLLSCSAHRLAHTPLIHKLPLPSKLRGRLNHLLELLALANRPSLLMYGTFLGVLSWGCQVLALCAVVDGFGVGELGLQTAAFAYCVPLLAGVVAFMPGGLGITEAGMVQTLQMSAGDWITPAAAASITLLVRAATFWFAIVVGGVALLIHRRYFPWSATGRAWAPA
jgi:glycosyltransferase 2 family protein